MSIELHVWGTGTQISVIDPESRACAWLLSLHLAPQNVPFKIVPSSNTNLADSGRLPLLLVKEGSVVSKYEGYNYISWYVCDKFPNESKFIPDSRLSAYELLMNLTLVSFITGKIQNVHKYNLYVNRQNYELFTRKLFRNYLPFPMNYRQPLRLYNEACEQVKLIGLGSTRTTFMGLSGESETQDLEDDDEDTVAISALHEQILALKEKDKSLLRETRQSLRCLSLLGDYIGHIYNLFNELNPNLPVEFAHLFRAKKISSSELLLYSYIYSLTRDELPDKFVATYLSNKFPAFWDFSKTLIEALEASLKPNHFRTPSGAELPLLLNEIGYQSGMLRY